MPGRILIVDDEKDMLVLLKRIITEETDYEVVTEADPIKALERFKEKQFDLVLRTQNAKLDGIRLRRVKDPPRRVRCHPHGL
jgi:CheY-like chemotaxis protein